MHLPNYSLWLSCGLLLTGVGCHSKLAWAEEIHPVLPNLSVQVAHSSQDQRDYYREEREAQSARQPSFFEPYRADIVEHLQEDSLFRLPSNLYLLNFPDGVSEQPTLQIIPSLRGGGLMVNLSFCPDTGDIANCIIGHFSTMPLTSSSAQDDLAAHQSIGYPITLAPGVQAHFREYRDGPIAYASVMWIQDEQFYRVQFPAAERQNMLYMALEMVNGNPITPGTTPASPLVTRNDLQILQVEDESNASLNSRVTEVVQSLDSPLNLATLIIGESSLFTEQEVRSLLTQIQTIEPNFTLRNAADQLTQEYINRGYITSRVLPTEDGGIEFQEGVLNHIEIEGAESIDEGYIRSRLYQVGGPPLNLDRLEERLRLLRLDPLFSNVEATLRRVEGENSREGGVDLYIRVTEAQPFIYGVSINNDSAPTVGAEQFELRFTYLNVTGVGDRAYANYSRSFAGGLSYLDLGYQVPLSPTNTTLRFSGSFVNTTVIEPPFNELGVQGTTSRYGVWLRQPLIRRPQQEFALSLGFTHTAGQTFLFDRLPTPFGFGPGPDGFSRTSVIHFAQDYVIREPSGAWALNSQFNFGTGLFDATQNPYPVPDGQFFSWQGLAQRVQRIGNNHLFIAQFNVQLTPDALLPSQSFTIGGVNSVRGYRQGARSGDNGLRFSLEDRITVQRDGAGRPVLILTPFVDLGSVWNHPENPNTITGRSFLMGSGLGLLLQNLDGLDGLSFRLNYGIPILNLENRGNNLQDSGFYFGIDYNSAPNR